MDFYDSKAAVDAMAALQNRIKDLERTNDKLRKESSHLRRVADSDENAVVEREAALMESANKAQKMLEGASETLVELRRLRRENRELQMHFEQLQDVLQKKLEGEERAQSKLDQISSKRTVSQKLISEYEDLFCEILAPPFPTGGAGNVPFNSTTISITTHSLPATLQTCVQMLQTLPYPFREQKLEKKKEIISILLNARDISYKVAEEIHQLEIQKLTSGAVRRIQSEIDVKSTHLNLFAQAMSRFRFE